jgi:hypothetical protein
VIDEVTSLKVFCEKHVLLWLRISRASSWVWKVGVHTTWTVEDLTFEEQCGYQMTRFVYPLLSRSRCTLPISHWTTGQEGRYPRTCASPNFSLLEGSSTNSINRFISSLSIPLRPELCC